MKSIISAKPSVCRERGSHEYLLTRVLKPQTEEKQTKTLDKQKEP